MRVCRHDRVLISPSWIAIDSNSESGSVSRWRRMRLLLAKFVRCSTRIAARTSRSRGFESRFVSARDAMNPRGLLRRLPGTAAAVRFQMPPLRRARGSSRLGAISSVPVRLRPYARHVTTRRRTRGSERQAMRGRGCKTRPHTHAPNTTGRAARWPDSDAHDPKGDFSADSASAAAVSRLPLYLSMSKIYNVSL